MAGQRYTYWKDRDMWLGYFEEYPDHMTQGATLAELEDNLRDIYRDLSSGGPFRESRRPRRPRGPA